jgi:uncharacterized membrane protein (UPF0136 family)
MNLRDKRQVRLLFSLIHGVNFLTIGLTLDEIDDISVDAARAAVAISFVQFVARVSRAEKPLSIGQFTACIPNSLRRIVWSANC